MTASSRGVKLEIFLLLLVIFNVRTQEISIQSFKPVHRVSEAFISFNIDPNVLLDNEFSSENLSKMLAMSRALSPAYVRLAGPNTFQYQFVGKNISTNNNLITESQIEAVGNFARAANLRLILAMSANLRTKDGAWDTTQAKQLLLLADNLPLDVAVQMGYDRLRSEPSVSGASMANDIKELAKLIHEFPRFSDALLLGPDVSNLDSEKEVTRCAELLSIASNSLSAITWHPTPFVLHPSKDGEKIADRATGALASLVIASRQFNNVIRMTLASNKDIWLGGTRSTNGRYVDAMMWISRLGQAAKLGVSVVMQTLKYDTLVNPSPEFWASLLYRQLVGRDVLDTQLNNGDRRRVHIFAHCSRQSRTSGGVTVFAVNYGSRDVSSNVRARWTTQTKNGIRRYVLTSTSDPLSRTLLLNGKTLSLLPNGDVPILEPELLPFNHGNRINIFIPKYSISFWEFPTAYAKACMRHNDYKPSNLPLKKRTSNITKREIQEFKTTNSAEEMSHFAEVVAAVDSGIANNFGEENFMHPGVTMYALLLPPNQVSEQMQLEPISIDNITAGKANETEVKTELLNADVKSELSPAEMYFGFGEVSPVEQVNNVGGELQDELYAAEYKASINENKNTSTQLLSPVSEIDESSMFIISGSLNNGTENKSINVEDKTEINHDGQIGSKNTDELTEFIKIYSSEIKYDDAKVDNIQIPILDLNDTVILNNKSECDAQKEQAIIIQNNISTAPPDFILESMTTINIQPKDEVELLEPLIKNYTKSLDDVISFDNVLNQTEFIQVIPENDNFTMTDDYIDITTHEMPKRDLEKYRSFLHNKNYLKLKETQIPTIVKTNNIPLKIIDTQPKTPAAPLLEREITSEATILKFTSVAEQEKKTKNLGLKKSYVTNNSFRSRLQTPLPTLEESIRKRAERVKELRERIASMRQEETGRDLMKRQADDWNFDDPEEPVLDIPLNNTTSKTEATAINDFLLESRMNTARAPKLKFNLPTIARLPTLSPQTFPTLPPINEVSFPTLPPVEINTIPPFTAPSFPTINPENIFTLPSLPFTLPTARPSVQISSEESSEQENAGSIVMPDLNPLPRSLLTMLTTAVPNTSPSTSLLDRIKAKLAERFPPRNRQRRHLTNNKLNKLESLNIPTYIQANIPLLRLPPLTIAKPTTRKFEFLKNGKLLESKSTSMKKQAAKQKNPEIVFDENGHAYKKVELQSGKNSSDPRWPDEYYLKPFSGASPDNNFGSYWPFATEREHNDKVSATKPTCKNLYHQNCYARRAKRHIDNPNVENFRNSLLYRFKKWELEDKINKIDNSVKDDFWAGNKIVVSTIPQTPGKENVKAVETNFDTTIPNSTQKPKVKINYIKEAIHKLVIVPIVKGANRVVGSFRNFLNGARGC